MEPYVSAGRFVQGRRREGGPEGEGRQQGRLRLPRGQEQPRGHGRTPLRRPDPPDQRQQRRRVRRKQGKSYDSYSIISRDYSLPQFTKLQVHDIFKRAEVNNIVLAVRDRPFERTVTLHKDSTGHLGFQYREVAACM